MTTEHQINIAKEILKTGLVSRVFHSCHLLRDEQAQQFFPVYKRGEDQPYIGIDDSKGLFAYIRANGDATPRDAKLGGCLHNYDMLAPLRVVFFSDNEKRDFNVLTTQLAAFTFVPPVKLVRIITDTHRLLREEQPIYTHSFDGQTFYIAFDITINFLLLPSHCEQKNCVAFPNPIC